MLSLDEALVEVLKLRPSSVAQKLADTNVCLLNARDVQRSLADKQAPVLVFEAPMPALAMGILRAAKQFKAAIGLSYPALPRGEGVRPQAAFQELVAAAQETDYDLPLFLRAGPVALSVASEDHVAAAREVVFRLVDAGFTEVSFDICDLAADEAAGAVYEAAQALRERELGLEIYMRRVRPKVLPAIATSFAARELRVVAFTIASTALHDPDLAALARAVAPSALGIGEPTARVFGTAARRSIVGARFCRIAAASLPDLVREQLRERARRGVSGPAAIAAVHKELAALDEEARLRVEAMAYHEALELFAEEGVRGAAVTCASFLSEHSGY